MNSVTSLEAERLQSDASTPAVRKLSLRIKGMMKPQRSMGFRLDGFTESFKFSGCPLSGKFSFDDRVRFYAARSENEVQGRVEGRGLDLAVSVLGVDG